MKREEEEMEEEEREEEEQEEVGDPADQIFPSLFSRH